MRFLQKIDIRILAQIPERETLHIRSGSEVNRTQRIWGGEASATGNFRGLKMQNFDEKYPQSIENM